jgi:hypothetical protein
MTSKAMHYDVKMKLNKIDSQRYRNLRIPEIDWKLNEAAELFVKMIAQPKSFNFRGFETSQRSIDDIRTIVVNPDSLGSPIAINNKVAILPEDYWHFLRGAVKMTKEGCPDTRGKVFIRQHDDEFENSPFDESSFEWRSVNALFFEGGIRFYTDDSFVVSEFFMSYIRRMKYIHNAEDFTANGYVLPDGTALTGSQDCELPEHTHREVVDLAVLLITGELENTNGYQFKTEKLRLNNNV